MSNTRVGEMVKEARNELASFNKGADQQRNLVFDFFLAFSRFEYALKKAKYIRNCNGRAEAEWKVFAEENNDKFKSNFLSDLQKYTDFLTDEPPKIQMVKKGVIYWKDNKTVKLEKIKLWQILLAVKTTRNNLFHGGKDHHGMDSARNTKLLEHCIIILWKCLLLDDDVERFYNEDHV